MGIDSREYLRGNDEFGQVPVAPMGVVPRIIIITCVVFVLQLLAEGSPSVARGPSFITRWFVLNADGLFSGYIWQLLTYAFLHSTTNLLHIVLNMLILYMMGRVTANITGDREFAWFYCAAAIFSGICSVTFYQLMKSDSHTSIVGASGAVLAVFTLFALHYPRQKLYLFGVLPIEARWLLLAYTLYDAVPVAQQVVEGNLGESHVAHSAHLGGLLFGWLYFRWNMRFSNWWDNFASRTVTAGRTRKAGLKVYNPKAQPEVDLSNRVDEILAKISEQGEGSLTDRERRILRQASEQMKKRN